MRLRHAVLAGLLAISLLMAGCVRSAPTEPKPPTSIDATRTVESSAIKFPAGGIPVASASWKGPFGSDDGEPQTGYTLIATGFFQGEMGSNVESVVNQWIEDHPKARVIEAGNYGDEPAPDGSFFRWAWVVDGGDCLNYELVRQGICAADQMRSSDDLEILVTRDEYDAFIRPLSQLGQEAEDRHVGIYQ